MRVSGTRLVDRHWLSSVKVIRSWCPEPVREAGRRSLAAPPRERANSLQPAKWLAQDFLFISIKLCAHYAAPQLPASPGGAKSHFHMSLQLAESQRAGQQRPQQRPEERRGLPPPPPYTKLQVKAEDIDCEGLVFSFS